MEVGGLVIVPEIMVANLSRGLVANLPTKPGRFSVAISLFCRSCSN
jgi:hypothetical protein